MNNLLSLLNQIKFSVALPQIAFTDIVEIILLSFLVYQCTLWIKNTRAYTLLKGALSVLAFVFLAYLLNMHTILWIFKNLTTVLLTALVVIFHPELRKALEQLGKKKLISSILSFDSGRIEDSKFSDKTVTEILRACFDMGHAKTGALIVIEQDNSLNEYEKTGIPIDALISSQLLINIFEHNTPLHDGAVIVRGNRIVSATCYLPLSDNMELSKQLGTRHRAAVGISEVTDSLTIVVSEETGNVSVAMNGNLKSNLNSVQLRRILEKAQNKVVTETAGPLQRIWRNIFIHEKETDK